MVPWCRGESTVARLRLRGAPADPLAARLRIDRILNETSLAPSALPPSAILCIRHLADPLPGSLALRGNAPGATGAWTRALTSAVARMAERAARPALGAIPADVPAIVFLDRAELLACLASDWCDGSLARRWWWRSLFRVADLERLATGAWLEQPEHGPAAFEHLSRGTRMLPFVRKLGAADIGVLLDRVTAAFGLLDLRVDVRSLLTREDIATARGAFANPGPWSRRVPEASASALRLDEACLIGVSLMLHRAPAEVRSPMFVQAVREWSRAPRVIASPSVGITNSSASMTHVRHVVASGGQQGRTAGTGDTVKSHHDAVSMPSAVLHPFRLAPSRFQPGNGGRTPSIPDDDLPAGIEFRSADTSASFRPPDAPPPRALRGAGPSVSSARRRRVVEPRMGQRAAAERVDAVRDERITAAPRSWISEETPADASLSPSRRSARTDEAVAEATTSARTFTASPPRAALPAVPIVTSFGGLFYLINVGISLELYSDFTAPLKPGIALSIWDFIAAVGERLAGDRLHADPVWEMLAHLAGRQDADAPGRDFEPPHEWRIPMAWLEPFPSSAAWRWSGRRGRLRVRHPAGFLIIDVPLDAGRTPTDQLELELRSYEAARPVTLRPARVRARHSPPGVDWWLDHVQGYLHARLASAWHLPDRCTIGRALIEHDARVFLTGSDLDVVFSLADLPLAIRLSGLDRNPGWVPAAGRRVAFAFE